MTEVPSEWSVYLAVADARKTADAVAANGGQILVPAMDIADLGTMAVTSDPDGARIGIWQPKLFHGLGVLGEAGAPSWFELYTRDYDKVVLFYREVFGWDTEVVSDTPEFRYTTLKSGEDQLAGVMDATGFLPDGAPANWSVYFWVNDADAASAKILDLGGSIVRPAEDTPYGRLASAADVTGAHFNIMAANAAMPATEN
jgi:predicted enzyme related to lactoylglutathione lyase